LIDFIHHEKGRNASPASINRRLNTLDIFYRFCFEKQIPGTRSPDNVEHLRRERYITMDSNIGIFPIYSKGKNPFRVRMPHKLVKALEKDEVEQFFSTLHSYRNKSIVMLMLICGLRSQEVLNLKLCDINTFNKRLKVLGKGNKERIVPVPDNVLEILNKYIETERPTGKKSVKLEEIFLNKKGPRRGLPMTIEGLRGVFRYNRAVSGIKHANPHRFRHTFGKNMAQAGVTIAVLQKILGHNDYKTTLKYINLTLNDVHDDFEKAQEQINKAYAQSIQQ
jgi:integrase/recombinase XerC